MGAYGATQLASSFRTVRANTIQIAEDIPESKYDFAPVTGTRSVSELLRHIAFIPMLSLDMHRDKHVTTLQGYDFFGTIARAKAEEAKPRTKAEIVALLTSEGERFASWLDTLTPEFLAETFTAGPAGEFVQNRLTSLHSPKEHEMHHRGQLMLIERMIGVVPHLTRRREEASRQAAQGS